MNKAPIQKHLESIDYLRGLAIIGVYLVHALNASYAFDWGWNGWFRQAAVPQYYLLFAPLTMGWLGVTVFFVVSGFCIHLSFLRNPDWKDYVRRRFFRIYPPYLLALLFFALVLPSSRLKFQSAADFGQILSHLLMVHNLNPTWHSGINLVFWSIGAECQLYLMYPLLLALAVRIGWNRSLAALCAVSICYYATKAFMPGWCACLPVWLEYSPVWVWFSWAIGAAVANDYAKGGRSRFAGYPLWLLGVLGVLSNFIKPFSLFTWMFFAVLTGALIAKLMEGWRLPVRMPAFLAEHIKLAGIWSYSIYLMHQAPLAAARPIVLAVMGYTHPLLIFFVCVCLWLPTMLLGVLMYRFCELPSIEIGKSFLPAKTCPRRP